MILLVLPAIGGFGAAPQSLVGAVALPSPFGNLVVPDAGLSRVFYLAFRDGDDIVFVESTDIVP